MAQLRLQLMVKAIAPYSYRAMVESILWRIAIVISSGSSTTNEPADAIIERMSHSGQNAWRETLPTILRV